MCAASGYGCIKRYIDFLILLISTPLVSVIFKSSIPTFCSFFNVFGSCSRTICNTFYVLKKFSAAHTGDYGRTTAAI